MVQVLVESRTETRWTPVDDGLFCIEYEEQRRGTRHPYYFRPHVWNASQKAWVDGPRNPFPYFTEPVLTWSTWARSGGSRLCPGRSEDGSGEAQPKPAQLAAGGHEFVWGEVRFSFTVPVGATVRLSARRLGSGVEAAVSQALEARSW